MEDSEDLIICELDGYRYLLGPMSQTTMTWDEASDWARDQKMELPSRLILLACYMNSEIKSLFDCKWYWSSTEFAATYAWTQDFGNGNQSYSTKNYSRYVRAVRKVLI